jgi:hypothetical protein
MKIKRMLVGVLLAVGIFIPCFSEAGVDIVPYWNLLNVHTRYFKPIDDGPGGTFNWVRGTGFLMSHNNIPWYGYIWSFYNELSPDWRAHTAFGVTEQYLYDGFDKFISDADQYQMFNPYKIISGRYVNLFDEWTVDVGWWRWATTGWYDWTLGDWIGSYPDSWGVNDIWSGSITYYFKDGTSKTWTGEFIELVEKEIWNTGSGDGVYHLMKNVGLIGCFFFPSGVAWDAFQQGKQNGVPGVFPGDQLISADGAYR